MEAGSYPYLQIRTDLRLIKEFQPIVSPDSRAPVIVHPVERISEIKSVTIFITSGIRTVIIRHHISSTEKTVADAEIPFLDLQIQLTATWKHIMSYKDPVVLHCLKPAQARRKFLKPETICKVKFHKGIQENIVHHSLRLLRSCEMIHIS